MLDRLILVRLRLVGQGVTHAVVGLLLFNVLFDLLQPLLETWSSSWVGMGVALLQALVLIFLPVVHVHSPAFHLMLVSWVRGLLLSLVFLFFFLTLSFIAVGVLILAGAVPHSVSSWNDSLLFQGRWLVC